MSDQSPTAAVMPIIMGLMTSGAVYALARPGVPDHLESGPKTVDELAAAVQAKPERTANELADVTPLPSQLHG